MSRDLFPSCQKKVMVATKYQQWLVLSTPQQSYLWVSGMVNITFTIRFRGAFIPIVLFFRFTAVCMSQVARILKLYRPVARIFRRGVTWMSDLRKHACKTRGGLGACSPRKFFEIRCSEIASEAIFGHRSTAVVAIWLAEYCIQFLAVHMHLLSQHDFEFSQEKVLKLAEQQMHHSKDNSRASELAIYLRTYLCASFHHSGVNSLHVCQYSTALVFHE